LLFCSYLLPKGGHTKKKAKDDKIKLILLHAVVISNQS